MTKILNLDCIWEESPHNAFTDLARFQDRWFCVFREGAKHISPDGALRVLSSEDGENWETAHVFSFAGVDMRDAHFATTPDGRLMLAMGEATHNVPTARNPQKLGFRTLASFSGDGRAWSEPHQIGPCDEWLWRVVWHDGIAYSIGYDAGAEHPPGLYTSRDGIGFEVHVKSFGPGVVCNESALLFLPDGRAICIMRGEENQKNAQIGTASSPYRDWSWQSLERNFGAPQLLRVPDGRVFTSGRIVEGDHRTALCEVDVSMNAPDALQTLLILPSGGDTSYPGMVWHENKIWLSYYSSHEGKCRIYLAQIGV